MTVVVVSVDPYYDVLCPDDVLEEHGCAVFVGHHHVRIRYS